MARKLKDAKIWMAVISMHTPFSVDPKTLVRKAGTVTQAIGTVLHVRGIQARVGERCVVQINRGAFVNGNNTDAEVVGVLGDELLLMPYGGVQGIGVDSLVVPTGQSLRLPVGECFLGRVIDARGKPIDGGEEILEPSTEVDLVQQPPSPLTRRRINQVFRCGVRSIDMLCTVGEGQRVGIFAPAGVGKSVLLGMLTKHAQCEVIVIGLIGERGREVREFVEDILGEAGMKRTVMVVATADTGAIERTRAAYAATAMAEYFRDRGKNTLLLIDSLTRFARAQRELGLARGEPPTRRGYPPSLFAALPQLLERTGNSSKGTLTAFYTVLMEDEVTPDPIVEEVRSLLDGHLILSRQQGERGIYPALDVNASLSRLMHLLVDARHQELAARIRLLIAKRADAELLVQMGEYKRGLDQLTDAALDQASSIDVLLKQQLDEYADWSSSRERLQKAAISEEPEDVAA
jgi:ATP synthase in type III secretion protein N